MRYVNGCAVLDSDGLRRTPPGPSNRLLVLAGLLFLVGALEGVEAVGQRRRGFGRSLVTSGEDRDPASCRLLALTWWPAGIAALLAAVLFRPARLGRRPAAFFSGGILLTCGAIALRQWAIATLGPFFVGHVLVQPEQAVVSSGPYRWLRHPSYTGFWLEMVGIGVATGNAVSLALCLVLPLIGVVARVVGEERELLTSLPGYAEYARGKYRLVPLAW
jgi:protein-S-isoprenylcysteine O-methyltransferase Ste14